MYNEPNSDAEFRTVIHYISMLMLVAYVIHKRTPI